MSGTTWFDRNPKKTLGALVILAIMLFTLAAEKFLAYVNRDYNSGIQRFIRLREYPPLFSRNILPPQAELQITDNLERKPYKLRIDGDGFIIPSRVHEKPDLTLVFLGGSSTACGYMNEEDRFPYAAGRLVEKDTGLKTNSFNSGVGGNNSMHSLNILFNKVIPLKPEFAFLCHNINDLTTLLLEGSYWSANPSRSNLVTVKPSISGSLKEIRDLLIPHLSREVNQLSRELKQKFRQPHKKAPGEDEFARVRDKKIQVDEAALRQSFRNNLQLFIDLCRLQQIRPILLTQASRLKEHPDPVILTSLQDLEKLQGLSYLEYKKLFAAFNEEIRAVAKKNVILVIDLASRIPPEKEYLYDIVHFTAPGSRQAAELIAGDLKTQLSDLPKNITK